MSIPESHPPVPLRCRQPGVTADSLDHEITRFERYLAELPPYGPHLRWWLARFSRGDDVRDLRGAFGDVVEQVELDGESARGQRGQDALLFTYERGAVGRYRDVLVLLSLALCLGLPEATRVLLKWCERGDPLLERLAEANGAPGEGRQVPPPYPDEFDGLYAALEATDPGAAAEAVHSYLHVWFDDRMAGMGFQVSDAGLGYWCFEAAGVVAASGLDDRHFVDEIHYPADLLAFYREGA